MGDRAPVHIGTSGWHYQHWKGPFYPEGLPDDRILEHYVTTFHTAEINNTFYQLPAEKTVAKWRDSVPDGFLFAVKGSRYMSHVKKLKDPGEPVSTFVGRVGLLGDKLGPILFQLPPRWHSNTERLQSFLRELPGDLKYSFEFRDSDWFNAETEQALRDAGAAFCIYDLDGTEAPHTVTADFTYVRLHGPDGAYQGKYDDEALSRWAREFADWSKQGTEVFCYFDNDENGYAAVNALRLQELVRESGQG